MDPLKPDTHVAFALLNGSVAAGAFWYYRKSGKTWAMILGIVEVSALAWNLYSYSRASKDEAKGTPLGKLVRPPLTVLQTGAGAKSAGGYDGSGIGAGIGGYQKSQ